MTSALSGGGGGRSVIVYHEKQSLLLQHCAVHTLNNVLQAPAYTAKHFEDLARSLHHGRFLVDSTQRQESMGSLFPSVNEQRRHRSRAGNISSPAASVGTGCAAVESGNSFASTTEDHPVGKLRSVAKGAAAHATRFRKASRTQPGDGLGGISPPPHRAHVPLQGCPPSSATSEEGLSWRTWISSTLLGTDYSAPLGIGNYDLSLLQHMLCFHRLSLNFANSPDKDQPTKGDGQGWSILPVNKRSGAWDTASEDFRKRLGFSRVQQQPDAQIGDQEVRYKQQYEPESKSQLHSSFSLLHLSSRQRRQKQYELFGGCVTIAQLQNPRLLAFILNVQLPRKGWRRLVPILGAERHFYTIRKVSCDASPRGRPLRVDSARHFIAAVIPDVEVFLGAPATPHEKARAGYGNSPEETGARDDAVDSDHLCCCGNPNSRNHETPTRQPTCDSQVATRLSNALSFRQESRSNVHPGPHGTRQKACSIPRGKCGVDFVWLDLDSNLGTPRVFESETALLVHLNSMLEEAFSRRGEPKCVQRGYNTEAQRKCEQQTATGKPNNIDSTGPCAGSTFKAHGGGNPIDGVKQLVGSRWCGVENNAPERARLDLKVCATFCGDTAVEWGYLELRNGRNNTQSGHDGEVAERRRYHNGVGAAAGQSRGYNSESNLQREGRFFPHRQENSALEPDRAHERRAKTFVQGTSARCDAGTSENGDIATYREQIERNRVSYIRLPSASVSRKDMQEDHRGYKDLILIEVLQDEEQSDEVSGSH